VIVDATVRAPIHSGISKISEDREGRWRFCVVWAIARPDRLGFLGSVARAHNCTMVCHQRGRAAKTTRRWRRLECGDWRQGAAGVACFREEPGTRTSIANESTHSATDTRSRRNAARASSSQPREGVSHSACAARASGRRDERNGRL